MSHANMKAQAVQEYKILAAEGKETKQYDLAVVMGRFEPQHVGHSILFNKSLLVAKRVLILVGSSYVARTIKNPFTYEERVAMIMGSLSAEDAKRVTCSPLVDNLYSDDDWVISVQDSINQALPRAGWEDKVSIQPVVIVGNKKDESSYYLDLFPQYEYIGIDEVKLGFDATTIREILFEKPGLIDLLKSLVPEYTFEFMKRFMKTEEYFRLQREYYVVKKYRDAWKVAPYAPNFVTVDAIVKKAGHILMIKRKAAPGEGLWALPGGFIEQGEGLADAAIRELLEETAIDLPRGLLRGSMSTGIVFDHPNRSLRGRTITHGFLFDLDRADNKPGLPKVKGGDDAAEAKWLTVADLLEMSDKIYEDHLSIIRKMLGV
jgi:bifunctional NMN adenylyltransferase/nudix hydrolase